MGNILAIPEGVYGMGRRCFLKVGFAAYLWVFLTSGAHLGCHDDSEDRLGEALVLPLGSILASPEGVCGFGGARALGSDSRRTCG